MCESRPVPIMTKAMKALSNPALIMKTSAVTGCCKVAREARGPPELRVVGYDWMTRPRIQNNALGFRSAMI